MKSSVKKEKLAMSLVTCALPAAVGLVAGIVMTGGGSGRVRAVVLRLLGHEGGGPPGEDHSSRVWPAVL
jgi:hypothetical protein